MNIAAGPGDTFDSGRQDFCALVREISCISWIVLI